MIFKILDVAVDHLGPYLKGHVVLPGGPVVIRWGIDWATHHSFADLYTLPTKQTESMYTLVISPGLPSTQTPRSATLTTPAGDDMSIPVTDLFLSNLQWLSGVRHADELTSVVFHDNFSSASAQSPQTATVSPAPLKRQKRRKPVVLSIIMTSASALLIAIVVLAVSQTHYFATSEPTNDVGVVVNHSVVKPIRLNTTVSPNANSMQTAAIPNTAPPTNTTPTKDVKSNVASPWHAVEVYEVPTGSVALTFDDGPSAYTEKILSVLKQNHVVASFFFVGNRVSMWPTAVRDVAASGCLIGDHSETHPEFTNLTAAQQMAQIENGAKSIESVDGQKPITLFRPPYGAFNDTTFDVLSSMHMNMALWNRDPRDWDDKTPAQIERAVIQEHPSGGVIDMHEKAATLAALPTIIRSLQEDGLKFVTMPDEQLS